MQLQFFNTWCNKYSTCGYGFESTCVPFANNTHKQYSQTTISKWHKSKVNMMIAYLVFKNGWPQPLSRPVWAPLCFTELSMLAMDRISASATCIKSHLGNRAAWFVKTNAWCFFWTFETIFSKFELLISLMCFCFHWSFKYGNHSIEWGRRQLI